MSNSNRDCKLNFGLTVSLELTFDVSLSLIVVFCSNRGTDLKSNLSDIRKPVPGLMPIPPRKLRQNADPNAGLDLNPKP